MPSTWLQFYLSTFFYFPSFSHPFFTTLILCYILPFFSFSFLTNMWAYFTLYLGLTILSLLLCILYLRFSDILLLISFILLSFFFFLWYFSAILFYLGSLCASLMRLIRSLLSCFLFLLSWILFKASPGPSSALPPDVCLLFCYFSITSLIYCLLFPCFSFTLTLLICLSILLFYLSVSLCSLFYYVQLRNTIRWKEWIFVRCEGVIVHFEIYDALRNSVTGID